MTPILVGLFILSSVARYKSELLQPATGATDLGFATAAF
jgi:hypothetical protein